MTNKEKFLALVAGNDSSVLEEAKWRIENRAWLKRSQAIALKILMRIDVLGTSQIELAKSMGVSPQLVNKWVRGKENLTLATISKFEEHLGIKLIELAGVNFVEELKSQKETTESPKMEEVLSETNIIPLNLAFSNDDNQYNKAV